MALRRGGQVITRGEWTERERESASLSAHSKAWPLRGCSVSRRPALGLEVKLRGCFKRAWRSVHAHTFEVLYLRTLTCTETNTQLSILYELTLQKWADVHVWSQSAHQDGLVWCDVSMICSDSHMLYTSWKTQDAIMDSGNKKTTGENASVLQFCFLPYFVFLCLLVLLLYYEYTIHGFWMILCK